ncbi:ECF transporter S component [uncultured Aeromicrobium sp.]|uniref:ECF transporter S component n=1 Tax=uncultured Aeromicrobium sp. TaxID=337820 RepID=UPI0025D88C1A|nr:ECF transporter S component [uncultured Aeromicrobium sp.]
MSTRAAIAVTRRSGLVMTLASAAGLMMFLWPFLLRPAEATQRVDQPFIFMVLLPVVALVVLAELSEGGMDAKALAILGVLTAINAALRGLGAGAAGIEMVFFLLILAGRVFGPGFGYVLGCTTMFASALLTSGVGPWLPFQMLCSAWIGMGAGLLPRRVGGRAEIALLAVYGIACAYLFGMLMNLASWPFLLGIDSGSLSFIPGDPVFENLQRFIVYTLLTSTAGWDTGRAITNTLLIVVLGPPLLATLRRAARRARYLPPAEPAPERRPSL